MRVGMLTPSSNTVVEPVTMRLAAPHADRLTVHFSRFPVTVISDEPRSHHQFDPAPMLAAARLLADAHVDVIVWNGTSGAWEGIEHDRDLARRIRLEFGIPATTATLALLELCGRLGVRRYGLVVPYIDSITDRIKTTFAAEGLTCVASANEGISTNADFALLSAETIGARVRGRGQGCAGRHGHSLHEHARRRRCRCS